MKALILALLAPLAHAAECKNFDAFFGAAEKNASAVALRKEAARLFPEASVSGGGERTLTIIFPKPPACFDNTTSEWGPPESRGGFVPPPDPPGPGHARLNLPAEGYADTWALKKYRRGHWSVTFDQFRDRVKRISLDRVD